MARYATISFLEKKPEKRHDVICRCFLNNLKQIWIHSFIIRSL